MPNTYACKGVSNPNVPIFPPRVCTLVFFILTAFMCGDIAAHYRALLAEYSEPRVIGVHSNR